MIAAIISSHLPAAANSQQAAAVRGSDLTGIMAPSGCRPCLNVSSAAAAVLAARKHARAHPACPERKWRCAPLSRLFEVCVRVRSLGHVALQRLQALHLRVCDQPLMPCARSRAQPTKRLGRHPATDTAKSPWTCSHSPALCEAIAVSSAAAPWLPHLRFERRQLLLLGSHRHLQLSITPLLAAPLVQAKESGAACVQHVASHAGICPPPLPASLPQQANSRHSASSSAESQASPCTAVTHEPPCTATHRHALTSLVAMNDSSCLARAISSCSSVWHSTCGR